MQPGQLRTDQGDAGRRQSDNEIVALRETVLAKLTYAIGKDPRAARAHDWFIATALAVRDRIVDRWMASTRRTYTEKRKRVYYLSVEYLIGRLLFDALGNLGLTENMREALAGLSVDLDALRALEPDAALGNGGLGRLAACFMDSMASLGMPAHGYGIRYEHGLFKQGITDGWQHEYPEDWLSTVNPWEFERPEVVYPIGFGGTIERVAGGEVTARAVWHPGDTVLAVAYDTPVAGWRAQHVNTLRLWSARAAEPLHLSTFNEGEHLAAMASRTMAEAITRVLYPGDVSASGQELRLRQEFFFTSASLQDLLRRERQQYGNVSSLPEHAAIQLNDTHPAIAVVELLRLLYDEHGLSWGDAWRITRATLNYTNHTLLPEALETWPVPLMERLLPRHMQLIYALNWLHLQDVGKRRPNDPHLASAVSLIDEGNGKNVRMGHLAFLGSNKVNGVSALHTDLMRRTIFSELNALHPGRIVNKTNGITFRRWLYRANPELTGLLVEACGERVLDDPDALTALESHAGDAEFVARLQAVRQHNKDKLAAIAIDEVGVRLDPRALFDVQVKRIHEYKRQLLNLLETVALYRSIRASPNAAWAPRVKIFAGKAAASYTRAKLIIKLANDIARVVNGDRAMRDVLKVVFLPNYSVSLAEGIIPAADLSEQISTAGMEASGTGNMKLALNGALTIGTLDGANVEIREKVGTENIVIFGMTTPEVAERRREKFTGAMAAANSPRLRDAIDSIASGVFSPDEPHRFQPIVESLLAYDTFMVAADFDAYWEAQRLLDALWHDPAAWWRMSVINTARMGWFSSDRTIREYGEEIWQVPVGVTEGALSFAPD
jgi:starch phosphorylase